MLTWFRRLFQLPPGASTFADGVDTLHLVVIAATLLGALAIFVTAGFWSVRYRQRGAAAKTPRLVASNTREGALIAAILGLFLALWVVGYRQYSTMRRPPANATTVYVTAKQWMWKFAYPSGKTSNDVLTVALHSRVQLIMTSRDVIHSLFVPAFRLKQDVLPGRYVTLWFEATRAGEYPIACAEYCGVSHSRMSGQVRVLAESDYAAWLNGANETSAASPTLAAVGRVAALKHGCFACHTVDGQPHIGPTWARLYASRVELQGGGEATADADYLTRSMMDPQAEIVAGFRPVMPTYQGSIAQPDVAAIVEYIRSLEGGPEPGSELTPPLPSSRTAGAPPLSIASPRTSSSAPAASAATMP